MGSNHEVYTLSNPSNGSYFPPESLPFMKILNATETRTALPFDRLIEALRRMFVEGCEVPLRHTHTLKASDGSQGTVLIMPAWRADRYLGIKTVNILPGLFATYVLYDARTGEPLAHIDGNEITARRTAAASALAASMLARPNARRLLVVGAGRVASLIPEAYRQVLPIEEVQVWARKASQAQLLVNELKADGIAASVASVVPRWRPIRSSKGHGSVQATILT